MIAIAPVSNGKQYSAMEYIINHIFLVFKKLTHLIFTESSYLNVVELRFSPPIHFCSSTLLVLKIKISTFYICLFLVDGRFSQLHTLVVESGDISVSTRVPNKVCFY